jgi:outer membrane lipoprotein carrier protein
MGGRAAWIVAVGAVVLPAVPPLRLSAQETGPVLARAGAAYADVSTLTAAFTQIVINPLLGTPDTARGTLYLLKPNHFAMRFTRPAGDRIVADGRHLWIYTPSTTPGQVLRRPIPESGPAGPNLIGQFVERPEERYTARYVRAESVDGTVADVVTLVPKSESADYREAVIWVSRDDGMLRRLRVNAEVPPREVSFAPPRGVKVVDL